MVLPKVRYHYWKFFFSDLGKNVRFYGSIKVYMPNNISVGNNCAINEFVILNGRDEIIIGNNVIISPLSIINTGGLIYDTFPRKHFSKKVIIKNNVWIGTGAQIMPGVSIGENSVIGGGAVVTRDIPPNSVAMGIPASVKKTFVLQKECNNS